MAELNDTFKTSLSGVTRSLFTLPTIGLPVATIAEITKTVSRLLISLGIPRGIPIFASKEQEVGENSIGKQILLRSGSVGTQWVTDNDSPQPRKWKVDGYLAHPHIFTRFNISGALSYQSLTIPVILSQLKAYFRYLRNLREPFVFTTKEGEAVPVLMENYTFEELPDSEWATKISVTLVEYIALSATEGTYDLLNAPSDDSIFGNGGIFTGCAAKTIATTVRAIKGFF